MRSDPVHQRPPFYAVLVILTTIYFIAGKLGLKLALVHTHATAVWPPTGIALAALLLFGQRLWPGILAGAFLVNITTGDAATFSRTLASIGIAAGNTLEAVVGAYLVNRFAGGRRAFDRARDVFAFAAVAALLSTMVSATIGVISLTVTGLAELTNFPDIWTTWWIGDAAGALLFAPPLILWAESQRPRWSAAQAAEAGLLVLAVVTSALAAFTNALPPHQPHLALAFLCAPALFWAAFRFTPREAATAMLVLSGIAAWGALHGLSAAHHNPLTVLLELQAYLGVTSVTLLAVAAEVANRRQHETALALQAENLREHAELGALAPVLVRGIEDRIRTWSAGAERLYGFTRAEAVGEIFHVLLRTRFPEPLEQIRNRLFSEGRWEGELRHQRRDGAEVAVASLWVLHRDKRGAPAAILEADNDITDLRRAEQARLQLAAIVESSDDAIIRQTLDGKIASWNRGAESVYGYSASEAIDQPVSILLPPEREEELSAIMERIRRGESVEHFETRHRRKEGAVIDVSVTVSPINGRPGEVIGASMVVRDITDRKHAEGRFQLAVESAPNAMVMVNQEGTIVLVNSQTATFFGYSQRDLIGMPIEMLVPKRFRASHPEHRKGFHAEPRVRPMGAGRDLYGLRKDGSEFPVEIGLNPIETEEGTWVLGAIVDITERKRAEQERAELLAREQAARSEAERANRLKDEFLAMVSHELRTPLTAVLGWTRLLQSTGLDESTRKQALEVIERNARAQAKLIDEILEVSRIVSGKLRLQMRVVGLAAVFDAAVETIAPTAEAKRIRLEKRITAQNALVLGDPERLQQVIWNLVSNGLKFTPEGGRVEIRLDQVGPEAEIRVSDTGEGIHPDFLPYVFEPFRQSDATTSRSHGGLGLGLTITRHLVEAHGGTVQAHSSGPGKGATFTVRLPLASDRPGLGTPAVTDAGTAETEAITSLALDGIRILLVEDDADTRAFLASLLESYGANVTPATSAEDALKVFETETIDTLVSDIGLPGEDGYALMRRIRARGAERGGQVPAVALTAYARAEDRQEAIDAGFQVHLPKPVDPTGLARVITRLAKRQTFPAE